MESDQQFEQVDYEGDEEDLERLRHSVADSMAEEEEQDLSLFAELVEAAGRSSVPSMTIWHHLQDHWDEITTLAWDHPVDWVEVRNELDAMVSGDDVHPDCRLEVLAALEMVTDPKGFGPFDESFVLWSDVGEATPDARGAQQVVAVPPPHEQPRDASEPVFRSLREELTKPLKEPEWLIRDILAKGSITSLAGYPGAGKTPFILRVVESLSNGSPFLDFPVGTSPGTEVIYLTQEADYTFLQAANQARLASYDNLNVAYWHENLGVPWGKMVERCVQRLRQRNGVLIVDVVLDWSGAQDENDSATMTEAYKPLMWAVGQGVGVLAVVHTTKAFDALHDEEVGIESVRGSGAVVGNSSIVLLYKVPKDSKLRQNTRYFAFGRSRFGIPAGRARFYVQMDENGFLIPVTSAQVGYEKVVAAEQAVLKAVRDLLSQEIVPTKDAIRAAAGIAKDSCAAALARLEDGGYLKKQGKGVRGDPEHWIVAEPD